MSGAEPNDYNGNEDYAIIFASGESSGKWNDVDNSDRTTLCWKKSSKSTTITPDCEDGWDKHNLGGEDYCLKGVVVI